MSTNAASEPVITFEGVRIGFDAGEVLHGVSMQVASRETKILVGETGSGKTLLLKLAAGLHRPDAGRIVVLGQEISAMSETELLDFRRQVGFVFQEGALFDSMSVEENVAYRLREEGVDEAEIEQKVHEALCFVELEDAIDKFPGELSGGMRRRVSIARALISAPSIVLYDSPTAGLDPVTAQTIITLILRLRDTQGVTALLATHRLQDAFAMVHYRFDAESGRVVPLAQNGAKSNPTTSFVVLREGAIYFEGEYKAINDSADAYVKKFLL